MTVTDEHGASSSDYATITVSAANRPPTADAGSNQSVDTGARVTLDGSDSSDPDGDDLTYAWTQLTGTNVSLNDRTSESAWFTAPSSAGSLKFKLTVTDEHGAFTSDDVTIAVRAANRAPIADAGSNQSVDTGARVTLDGSGSSDLDGDRLTYSWTQRSGARVSLRRGAPPVVTFTAPSSAGSLKFRLTVTDEHGASTSDDVTIAVRAANRAPIANAGRSRFVEGGATVTLDGSGSTDPDRDKLAYSWTQRSGARVSLRRGAPPVVTFTAPSSAGSLKFRLTVTDEHRASTSDDVTITVQAANRPPIANAGRSRFVEGGATVTLDGSGSTDPDRDKLTYSWTQRSGARVSLRRGAPPVVTFTAPSVPEQTALTFRLTVTDPDGLDNSDDVTITVLGSEGN